MGARKNSDGTIRLLIAEDEDPFAELVAVLAEHAGGVEVVGRARNGREAVELAASLEPSVVVMDIGMPLLNGLQATHRIRRRDPRVQVVIFTSSDAEADVRRAREVGAAAYVQKAHIDAVLMAAVRRAAQQDGQASGVERKMLGLSVAPAVP